ncbi:MAG: flavodoxin family protein [Deltaproteobacteria bacterium]|nr:flavodoxin family protein [Deltaproteobacteria bacterium]
MILAISGSPQAQTTEFVLKQATEMLNDFGHKIIQYNVRGREIGFCTHCNYCLGGNGCIKQDGLQELYPLLLHADAIIMASPVYHGGITTQLKAVLDRTRAIFPSNKNAKRGKPGGAIAIGGDRAGGQELALQQLHTYNIINGMIPPGGGLFGANLGASLWSKDDMEGIMADEEGLRSLKMTMKRQSEYLEEVKK